ncbi:MAG: tetratricopeptide repeat protein [Alphaproteobacteria bacterium]
MTDAPKIFISYSHLDETPWKELIVGHLRVAERQGDFLVWDDRRMEGGDDWRREIDDALEAADIGVLLISRHFLTSNFIMDHEVKVLLERKQREGLRLYPILLSGCNWRSVDWLERMNLKPLDAKPLDSFDDAQRESQAAGMATEIGHLLKEDRESGEEIDDLRAEAEALGGRLGVTEEAVQSFLDILDERHVDSGDLKDKLEEIAGQYKEMEARLTALDQDDPVIGEWIEQAKAAIDDGAFDEADDLLTQAEERDLSAARQAAAQADQRFLNAAATRAVRGEAGLTRLRYLDAAEHFAEAAKLVPDSAPTLRAGYLAQQGDALTRGNRTLDAIEAYQQATALDPDHTWLSIELGRMHYQAGHLSEAEGAFFKARYAAECDQDERDLSVCHNELGNVRVAQGDLDGALRAFQDGLAIAERLAEADPANAGWQRDLSVCHEKIGDVRVAKGDLDGALRAFQDSLAIAERLAEADPGNAGWQRDLSVSHEKIGDVRRDQGDLDGALRAYEDSLAIAERLAEADPGHAGWQRDLSVSHNKIGDVRVAQGDLDGALRAYEDSLAIRERLAAADPGNAGWQRDLIVSRAKLAGLAEQGYVSESALDHWRAALAIALELQESGRLAPRDAHFVETIQERIDALIAPAAGSGG